MSRLLIATGLLLVGCASNTPPVVDPDPECRTVRGKLVAALRQPALEVRACSERLLHFVMPALVRFSGNGPAPEHRSAALRAGVSAWRATGERARRVRVGLRQGDLEVRYDFDRDELDRGGRDVTR